MSEIVIGKEGMHNVSINLEVLMTTRLLLTADSGGGKTFALKRLIEQAFGKVGILIIDPEGEFAPLRQKLDFFLVGKGGDTPADIRSAEKVARTLLVNRASAICDIYEMKASERHIWVQRFLDSLLESPKELRRPYLVIVDESQIYCPENGKGESVAADAMRGLATRGRKRLLCSIFATQRLSSLAKDLTGMCLNRMVGPTFESINRIRAAEELGIPKERKERAEFFDRVRLLEPGYFFCLGRAISKELKLVHIGPIETPHGQEALKFELAPPPPTEKVRALLAKIGDLPKQAEEEARTAAEFKKQIRDLKQELVLAKKAVPGHIMRSPPERTVEQQYRRMLDDQNDGFKYAKQFAERIIGVAERNLGREMPAKPVGLPVEAGNRVSVASATATAQNRHLAIPRLTEAPRNDSDAISNGKLRSGAERMLAALAQWSPGGMSEGQVRSHAGLKKSGTYSAYKVDLRRGGYIDERDGMLFATDAGLEYCRHVPPAPSSTEEVLAIWNPKLRDGARRMLAILVELRGEPISKEELGERAGLAKSGTRSAYLGDLKTARLAVVQRDTVAANKETLLLE